MKSLIAVLVVCVATPLLGQVVVPSAPLAPLPVMRQLSGMEFTFMFFLRRSLLGRQANVGRGRRPS